jgi:hypothetical protein
MKISSKRWLGFGVRSEIFEIYEFVTIAHVIRLILRRGLTSRTSGWPRWVYHVASCLWLSKLLWINGLEQVQVNP